MNVRKICVWALTLGALLAPATPASAAPEPDPAWRLTALPLPTNFPPGAEGTAQGGPQYLVIATNVGGAATSGQITLNATLPAGITPTVVSPATTGSGSEGSTVLECSIALQVVTCASTGSLTPGRYVGMRVQVDVSSLAGEETVVAEASVGGGGGATVSTTAPTEISSSAAPFDFLTGPAGLGSFFTGPDGSPVSQAGSHPDQVTFDFGLPAEKPNVLLTSAGHVRDLRLDLPRGFVGNPTASPVLCTEAQLTAGKGGGRPDCPAASQVGVVDVTSVSGGPVTVPSELYNMVPPPGAAAAFGFNAFNVGIFVHVIGGVRSGDDYGLFASSEDIVARSLNPTLGVMVQLWGDPSAPSHDHLRGECRASGAACPVAPQTSPFLTMPSACTGPLVTKASADSWEEPGVFHEREAQSTDLFGNPVGVNGCSALEFEPTLTVQPDVGAAETPTGVHIDVHVPQNPNLGERATSNLRDTEVVFPAGLALNPAAGGGLSACAPGQIDLHGPGSPNCPESSKIGTVRVTTPLLDHPVRGAVYVAAPYDNPFNTLLAVYVVVDSPSDGVVIKLAGKTEADPDTGQLTTTVEEAPELPFEDFEVDLFGGSRAALRTPSTCGTHTTKSVLTPWSGTPPFPYKDSFQITQGANGGSCVGNEGEMPNSPEFEAGTVTPLVASYSPFAGRLKRPDANQQITALNLTLPPGLTGNLSGIATCSEEAIATARAKSGSEELAVPSCPDSSRLGETIAGAGAGPNPYYTTGKVYLAGPYKGAPISGVAIVPAVAGPFDLGNVVVRAPAYVDPVTAQLSIKSDELPHILEGIPLSLRDARIELSRDRFTLNPSSCNVMSIDGEAISLAGQSAPLYQGFQVGGCAGLAYAPKLFLRLRGGTRRGSHPKLRAVLEAKPGEEANTARASVALPRSEFLENAHIRTVCTRVQFAAHSCPPGSIYGHARAVTPLLDETVKGPVYLRSSDNELPDMVAALHGPPDKPIEIELKGRIDSVRGGIRTTFEAVPDQPVSKAIFWLKGGRKGLLVNSRDICARTYRATAKFDGQNGKTHDFRPKLNASCKKKRRSRQHRRLRQGG